MKLILHLIVHAALTSFYSISALKCYNCTENGFDDFCSSTPNSNVWQIIDCDGSCAEQVQLYHRFSRPSIILIFILIYNKYPFFFLTVFEPLYIETNRYCSKANEPGCSGPGAVFIEI